MHVSLPLQTVWLRARFSRVRTQLVGIPQRVVVPELNFIRSEYITVFSREVSTLNVPEQSESVLTQSTSLSSILDSKSTSTKPFEIFRHSMANFITAAVVLVSLVVAGVIFVPDLYYFFSPASPIAVSAQEAGSVGGGEFETGAVETRDELKQNTKQTRYLPPQDSNLPEGEWLSIPRIGVKTEFLRTVGDEDPETALRVGVWFVPGYGEPGDLTQPMIMAAHRFGYQVWWKTDYWKYNSFYFLPDTQPGDKVEIIQDQRRYVYEIYSGEETDEISDYDADLILYTCKFLNSPIRHIRYARLLTE